MSDKALNLRAAVSGYKAQYGVAGISEQHPDLPAGCVQRIEAVVDAAAAMADAGLEVRYYLPPRNAVLRESPIMAIYQDGRRVFKGTPLQGVWTALELAGVRTAQQPNEIFPEELDR